MRAGRAELPEMVQRYCAAAIIVLALSMASPALAEMRIDLNAIKVIESSNNPLAYNAKTRCYGLYQISEICLKEYNERHKSAYKPKHLFNPLLNKMIAAWYFKRIEQMLIFYKIPVTIPTVLACYNWGIGNVARWHENGAQFKNLPKMTQIYIGKYKQLSAVTYSCEKTFLSP